MENDPQNPETRSEWETLVDVLAGFRPEQVEPLAAARDLEMVYPLLHALTRGGLGEFFVRVAALEAFIADGRSPLKPQEAVQVLYWLKEPESILKILRESGWMEHELAGVIGSRMPVDLLRRFCRFCAIRLRIRRSCRRWKASITCCDAASIRCDN